MTEALLAGIFAGYAIAVPVGVIAVLIIETGMLGGLRRGLAAGAGAATVDLCYCAGALALGGILSRLLAFALEPLQVLSGLVLISIGLRGLRALARSRRPGARPPESAQSAPFLLSPCLCFPFDLPSALVGRSPDRPSGGLFRGLRCPPVRLLSHAAMVSATVVRALLPT